MISKSKKIKAIIDVIKKSFLYDCVSSESRKPGEFLQGYCKKELEILKETTSDDWKNLRDYNFYNKG